MNSETDQIRKLMEVFDALDSSRRKVGFENLSKWCPAGEKEQAAFKALIAQENRPALKAWYARSSSINPSADAFRRFLEKAVGEELPLGS